MGFQPLPLLLSMAAAAAPGPSADLAALNQACLTARQQGDVAQQELLRDRLLAFDPSPASLEPVLAQARGLISCGSPQSAFRLLSRYGPDRHERRAWLLLRWEAAAASLDHPRAALALRRLVDGDLEALEQEALPGQRNGLDQLAVHEVAAGQPQEAAAVLLLGRADGRIGAERLGRAGELLADADPEQADQLLERAVEQASAVQAWGQVVDLLRLQLRLQLAAGGDGARPRDRLLRLTARLEDRYGRWQLDGSTATEALPRSPRDPGGHAAVGEPSSAPSP
ncbi:MAG: hypothetical protein ACPHAS_03900 [Synechococcus sp.]